MSKNRITHAELKRRLDRLAASLLPADSLTASYTDAEKDRIHAYLLLAHAELEEFIENVARYAAERAKKRSTAPKCEPIISRLLLCKGFQARDHLEEITTDVIEGAFNFYANVLDQNHGIRSRNIHRILMPIGLNHQDFDPMLMANLDAFGQLRRDLAHTSARLRQGASPSSEKKKVDDILKDLAHLDQRIRTLVQ